MAKIHSRSMRNLKSAGKEVVEYTGKTSGKVATGIFRWAATDHTGMGRILSNMPPMGFIDSIRYVCMHFVIVLASALFVGILIVIFFTFGIPVMFKLLAA